MESRRSKLVAIDGSGPGAPPGPARARRAPVGPSLSRREWGLVALLVLALAALAAEGLRARSLAARAGELAGRLASSEARLQAHREHLRAVRGGVAAVRDELAGLEALAAQEPEAEPSTP